MVISIIIPVFNVQEYLPKCLDSLYSQLKDNMEVILVNDGSTDNSLAICKQYAEKYTNNTIIIDKDNGGLSDARNIGTEVASGDYVYYLDSDDWLAPNAISTLYDFAIQNNCEIVQGGFYYAYEDYLLYDYSIKTKVLNREKAMLELITNESIKDFSWGKLYKTDIVKKHMFPQGKYFEDAYWQHLIVHDIAHYGIVPTPLYYYRQRSSGISGTFSLKSLDLLQGYGERLEFIKDYYPNYSAKMVLSLWDTFYSLMSVAKKQENLKKAYEDYWEELNEKYGSLFEKYLSSDIRFRIWKSYPSILPLYDFILRIKSRINLSNLVKVSLK